MLLGIHEYFVFHTIYGLFLGNVSSKRFVDAIECSVLDYSIPAIFIDGGGEGIENKGADCCLQNDNSWLSGVHYKVKSYGLPERRQMKALYKFLANFKTFKKPG